METTVATVGVGLMDKVLIVEDSRPMQRALQRALNAEGYHVDIASDGPTGLNSFREQRPSAVLLDLKLPGIHGRELCREFKTIAPNVPVIVLSANTEVDDKVLLLELGADDYVTKPFSPKELLARVRRAMRRTETPVPKEDSTKRYRFADVVVDCDSMEVMRAGHKVTLTAQEFRVLKYFLEHPGRVISRDDLLNQVWGYNNYPSTRTVDNHILRLRQKLEADPSTPRHFVTLHGVGYKFLSMADAAAS
jgi:DNA-binding response OmpR family regulator